MAVLKIIVDEKKMVCLVCPFCGNYSIKEAKHFPVHQPVSMTCSCGKTYEFQIETRKEFRKETSLKGFYTKSESTYAYSEMTVIDLTLDGCCLLTTDKHKLIIGDSIRVLFKLDNDARAEIKRYGTVRWIKGNKIGCQFDKRHYDPDLGFYVRYFKVPK